MHKYTRLILQISCFLMFTGRAYEHLFFNPHYREFFWNPKLMLGMVNHVFGLTWNEYMTSIKVDDSIQLFIQGIGLMFLLIAICCLLLHKLPWLKLAPILGVLLLLPTVWFHYYGYWSNLVLLLEFTAQLSLPIILFMSFRDGKVMYIMKLLRAAIALTFIAHGLYAMNLVPIPQKFIAMTIKATGWSNAVSKDMLFIAGTMDLLVALGLFFPRFFKPSLIYLIAWGFITAFARIYCNYYHYDALNSLHQWTWQFLIRTAHYSLGIILFINSSILLSDLKPHFFSLRMRKRSIDEQYKIV